VREVLSHSYSHLQHLSSGLLFLTTTLPHTYVPSPIPPTPWLLPLTTVTPIPSLTNPFLSPAPSQTASCTGKQGPLPLPLSVTGEGLLLQAKHCYCSAKHSQHPDICTLLLLLLPAPSPPAHAREKPLGSQPRGAWCGRDRVWSRRLVYT